MKLTRGERFKDARTVHNAKGKQTMDEVAAATGVSKSLIQALEDDNIDRSVGYDKVAKLANHYGVSANFLLGLSEDPNIIPSAVDDLELSVKAVETIEKLSIWDTPSEQMQFRNGSGHALDVLNLLLENPYFDDVMGNLLKCFDTFWIHAEAEDKNQKFMEKVAGTRLTRKVGNIGNVDSEFEEDMRDEGFVVLKGNVAAMFYANKAADSLREFICKEIPILVDSIRKKDK